MILALGVLGTGCGEESTQNAETDENAESTEDTENPESTEDTENGSFDDTGDEGSGGYGEDCCEEVQLLPATVAPACAALAAEGPAPEFSAAYYTDAEGYLMINVGNYESALCSGHTYGFPAPCSGVEVENASIRLAEFPTAGENYGLVTSHYAHGFGRMWQLDDTWCEHQVVSPVSPGIFVTVNAVDETCIAGEIRWTGVWGERTIPFYAAPTCEGEPPENIPTDPDHCDPLEPNTCGSGEDCLPRWDYFECYPTGEGTANGAGCSHAADCVTGLVCANANSQSDCSGGSCCSVVCDLNDPDFVCPDEGETCQPYHKGEVPPTGFEHIGVCSL
jgi:hypothetical protein